MFFKHLGNLLASAWEGLTSDLGTTTIAVVLFSILVPVVGFGLWAWKDYSTHGWSELWSHIKSNLNFIGLRAIAVPSVIYVLMYSVELPRQIYKDHESLAQQNRLLASEDRAARAVQSTNEKVTRLLWQYQRDHPDPAYDAYKFEEMQWLNLQLRGEGVITTFQPSVSPNIQGAIVFTGPTNHPTVRNNKIGRSDGATLR